MRLSSKGLGRLSLPLDLREADVRISETDELWLCGRLKERTVRWTYRMRLDDADVVGFIALARDRRIVAYTAQGLGWRLLGRILVRSAATALTLVGLRRPAGPAAQGGAGAPRAARPGVEGPHGALVERPRKAKPSDRLRH